MLGSKFLITKPNPGIFINPSHPLSQGLIGCWLFNEKSGVRVNDYSTRLNHGTTVAAPAWGGSLHGSSLTLNGTTQYVTMPTLTAPNFTVCGWFLKTASGAAIAVAQNDAGFSQYSFYLRPGSNSGFSSGGIFQTVATADISSNVWHHVALTYNGALLTYYIDGAFSSSGTVTGVPDMTSVVAKIGTDLNQYWPGQVDEVRVYNRALTAWEISSLYGNPFQNFLFLSLPVFNPLQHLKFNNKGIRPRPFAPGLAR